MVPDVSRAILSLTELNQDFLKAIEDKSFKNETSCQQPSAEDDSYSLDLDSFRGLFLVAGLASFLALIIHTAMFLYGQRRIFMQFDSNASLWKKICAIFNDSKNHREQNSRDSNKISHIDCWIPEAKHVDPPSPPRYLNYACESLPAKLHDPS